MSIEALFTTYWSQLTLLLLAIGYIVKSFLDSRSKKIETTHSLFQQNKIRVINDFFQNYAKVELMWNNLPIHEILRHELNFNEIENFTLPTLTELGKTTMLLKLYTNSKECKDFESLNSKMWKIYKKLLDMYFSESNESIIVKSNAYYNLMNDNFKVNREIMESLCERVRKTFNS